MVDRKDSLPQLIDRSPYLTIGTPEFFIKRCRKLHDLGYNELICRIDGMSHEQHLATIKLLGGEVIPEIEKW